MRSLDTRLGAAFNLVLILAVVGVLVFVYGEPNVLVTNSLVPAPQIASNDANSTTFGKINFYVIAYAPRNEDCTNLGLPAVGGVSSGLSCIGDSSRVTADADPNADPDTVAADATQQLTVCNVTVACSVKSNFRGTEAVMLTFPDQFQNMEWEVVTSRWSNVNNATRIRHVLTPSPPSAAATPGSTMQLSGTADAPTVLNFGAIRSVLNDTLGSNEQCSIRGMQLLWRETDRKESTEGTLEGFHFVLFKIYVEETLFMMTLIDRLTEADKLSMVMSYVLSLIAAMKIAKILLQLLIDKCIICCSKSQNVHLPKDVKDRIEILDEHLIKKHESTLKEVHSHFKKIGVHVGRGSVHGGGTGISVRAARDQVVVVESDGQDGQDGKVGLLDAIGKFCVQCCSKDGINNDRDDIEQIEMGNIGTDRTNGAMVGLSTPPGTPVRMKDVLVAMPSPKKRSESKKSFKEETIPSVMSFGGAKEMVSMENPLKITNDRKRIQVMEKQLRQQASDIRQQASEINKLRQQASEISELKRMVQAITEK